MPTEADVLAIRLARIEYLLDSLEAACSRSTEQRDTFQKLQQELQSQADPGLMR
jgi:hypothetical protein